MILVYQPLFDRQFFVYRDKRNAIALIHFLRDVFVGQRTGCICIQFLINVVKMLDFCKNKGL